MLRGVKLLLLLGRLPEELVFGRAVLQEQKGKGFKGKANSMGKGPKEEEGCRLHLPHPNVVWD